MSSCFEHLYLGFRIWLQLRCYVLSVILLSHAVGNAHPTFSLQGSPPFLKGGWGDFYSCSNILSRTPSIFLNTSLSENLKIVKFSPDVSWITCCDHGCGRPSWCPRVLVPATYHSGTPRDQSRGTVARWHDHLRGLATAIHEISGLGRLSVVSSQWSVA